MNAHINELKENSVLQLVQNEESKASMFGRIIGITNDVMSQAIVHCVVYDD